MKIFIHATNVRFLLKTLLIVLVVFALQSCFFKEDHVPYSEQQENICKDHENEFVDNASQTQCEAADGTWYENEGCYCHHD